MHPFPLRSAILNLLSTLLIFAILLLLPTPGWASKGFFTPATFAPETAPVPGNTNNTAGEPVDLSTGLFVSTKTDLFLPDVIPLTLTRTYRTNDLTPRNFGLGSSNPYELILTGDESTCQFAELILPDGGRIRYTRSGSGCPGTVMEHTTTPTRFFKSTLSAVSPGGDRL